MVIYRFFQQTRKPKKNAKTSPLVSKTFPFSDVKKKKTFLWLSLLTDKSGKKGRKGILLFLTTFVRLRQSRFSCSPSFLPEMACHVTQHVPQTIDMPYYGSDFIRHFFVTFQRGRWFFVFSNDNLITTKPPKKNRDACGPGDLLMRRRYMFMSGPWTGCDRLPSVSLHGHQVKRLEVSAFMCEFIDSLRWAKQK